MFKIGDKVKKNTTGELLEGEVYGVLSAERYAISAVNGGHGLSAWDKKFPTWREGFVYFVDFDQLSRPMRLDEVVEQFPNFTAEEAQQYHNNLPVRKDYCCVENDLVLL